MSESTAAVQTGQRELRTYTRKESAMYLTGLAGQNVIYNIINGAFAYFAQFTVAIPALVVSTILTIARVWDAFNDPMMGTIVDRTRSKWGKCRPYLIFIPLPIMVVTIACFVSFGTYQGTPADLWTNSTNVLIVLWAAIFYTLWGMTYTIGDIPLWGAPALMTEVEHDRNKLLSYARLIAGIAGGIAMLTIQPIAFAVKDVVFQSKTGMSLGDAASVMTPELQLAASDAERTGFLIVAAVMAIIGCAMFQLTGIGIKERIPPSEEKHTLRENFALMWTNKPFRQVLLSGILGSPKNTIMIAAMPLINYYFAGKDPSKALIYTVLLGGPIFIGQFLIQALTPTLVQKFEKKTIYNVSNLMSVIPFALIFLIYMVAPGHDVTGYGYIAILGVVFFICGMGMGLGLVMQSVMIADAVDYEEYHNGIRPDGAFFSGQTFLAKLTSAIATIISGFVYNAVGFSDAKVLEVNAFVDAGNFPMDNPEYVPYMTALFFIVSIPPAVGSLLSVIPTWKYAQSDEMHDHILEELNARRRVREAQSTTDSAE